MFITKRHIPRRTFLHGMGVSVALPFVEAMLPAATPLRAAAGASPTRYAFVYLPHGMILAELTPTAEGTNFETTTILSPLEPFKNQLHVVSGLEAKPAGDGSGGDHMRSAAAFLSGTPPVRNAGQNAYLATTLDQVIAQKIGQESPLPSLELGIEDTSYTGVCDDGYACSYMNTISWAAPKKPLPMERNPLAVFERLFGDGSTQEQRLARRKEDRSILDSITGDVARIGKTIGPSDRARLGEYLDEVRGLEKRLQAIAKTTADLPDADAPAGIPQSWHEHAKLMHDLQALAFSADITRVSSFMYSRDKINRTFPESGITTGFHSASHTSGAAEAKRSFTRMNTYHTNVLATFLAKLKATPDGDGNLLDHTLVMFGSTMSNGDVHDHSPLPMMLIGGASGRLGPARHSKYPEHTPLANLLLTVLHKADIPKESFGDSTGPIEI
jgi:Protein of unknown function (DUF1552)